MTISDPEIPVLSVVDMGIIRHAEITESGAMIDITPTYSGCPATDVIAADIHKALSSQGINADIRTVLSPAWTTDWITANGRKALEEYGIAPPLDATSDKLVLSGRNSSKSNGLNQPMCLD